NHGLKDQLAADLGDYLVQRIERIAKVIEHPHEDDEIKLSRNLVHLVDAALFQLDLQPQGARSQAGLLQIAVADIDAEHPAGSSLLHLQGVEAAVAADVQHRGAAQIQRNRRRDMPPLHDGKIAEEVMGRRLDAVQIDVVEPLSQLRDLPGQRV